MARIFRIDVTNGVELGARVLQIFNGVQVRDAPGADEANTDFFHSPFLLMTLYTPRLYNELTPASPPALHHPSCISAFMEDHRYGKIVARLENPLWRGRSGFC